MRKTMLFLAFIALTGSLWAADPLIGTWKLNVAKSKFSPVLLELNKEAPPKESTIVIRELDADQLEVSETGTRTDGSAVSMKGTQPKQGGTVQSDLGQGIAFVHTVINEYDRVGTVMQNGKQIQVIHWVVSRDGKTLTSTRRSLDAQGKPAEHLAVYEKQ